MAAPLDARRALALWPAGRKRDEVPSRPPPRLVLAGRRRCRGSGARLLPVHLLLPPRSIGRKRKRQGRERLSRYGNSATGARTGIAFSQLSFRIQRATLLVRIKDKVGNGFEDASAEPLRERAHRKLCFSSSRELRQVASESLFELKVSLLRDVSPERPST